jgi:hypothetical protein
MIERGLQGRMIVNLVALNFCTGGLGLFIVMREVHHLRNLLEEIPSLSYKGHEELANALIAIVSTALICIVVNVVIIFISGLYLSHRYAGPMKVINDYIDRLKVGDFSDSRDLRPNDELKPIMAKLRELADLLAKKAS